MLFYKIGQGRPSKVAAILDGCHCGGRYRRILGSMVGLWRVHVAEQTNKGQVLQSETINICQ
jgi:hypothetical protein